MNDLLEQMLPAEFKSGNDIPVTRALITKERMIEILLSTHKQVIEYRPFTPRNAEQMHVFIGSNFDRLEYHDKQDFVPSDSDRYSLTVHDLLSAFHWCGHYDDDYFLPQSDVDSLNTYSMGVVDTLRKVMSEHEQLKPMFGMEMLLMKCVAKTLALSKGDKQ